VATDAHHPWGPRTGSTPRRTARRAALVVVAVTAVLLGALPAGAQDGAAQDGGRTTTTARGATSAPADRRPGRVAYATPSGDVVVAQSDGTGAVTIGRGAVANAVGLAPLAWSPGGSQVAYVRNDGALVLAAANGSGEEIVARDAVVPPEAGENLLSFDITGVSIAYLAKGPNDVARAMLAFVDGRPDPPQALSDPATRIPLELQFSPLDPYLYLRSADVETGKELTIAVVEPFSGQPTSSPFSVDDPAFAPDGKYFYAVVSAKSKEQLVRLDVTTARTAILATHDRICRPSPSPDGKQVVFAAGPECGEVWVIGEDGRGERQVAEAVGSNTFQNGNFTWALDGSVVSHAACRSLQEGVRCGGPYLDIAVRDGKLTRRAEAGSVRREQRPLIKALKVKVDLTGPVEYHGRLLVSARKSVAELLDRPRSANLEARVADDRDPSRVFSLKVVVGKGSGWVTGTLRVQDPSGVDETVTFIGSALLQSYRFARIRGIWMQTASMPMTTGNLDLVVYR